MKYIRLLPTPDKGMALLIRENEHHDTPWLQAAYTRDITMAKEWAELIENEQAFRSQLIAQNKDMPYAFPIHLRPIAWPPYNNS